MIPKPPALPAEHSAQGLRGRVDVVVAEPARRVMGFRRHRTILPRTGQISGLTAMTHPRSLVRVNTDPRRRRGAASEQLAAAYLQTRGLVVLAHNLRCRAGEPDLAC